MVWMSPHTFPSGNVANNENEFITWFIHTLTSTGGLLFRFLKHFVPMGITIWNCEDILLHHYLFAKMLREESGFLCHPGDVTVWLCHDEAAVGRVTPFLWITTASGVSGDDINHEQMETLLLSSHAPYSMWILCAYGVVSELISRCWPDRDCGWFVGFCCVVFLSGAVSYLPWRQWCSWWHSGSGFGPPGAAGAAAYCSAHWWSCVPEKPTTAVT